ncbi:MAG TPA: hypothetical protein VFE21_10390 [Rubrobacteraceae bacterium]|nr:hypothetical protein [Rubrobacteraceae bacterium]
MRARSAMAGLCAVLQPRLRYNPARNAMGEIYSIHIRALLSKISAGLGL